MPILTVVIPQIPAESKDLFLASWPQIVAAFKNEPSLRSISGGQIVASEGAAVTDFQFLQLYIFDNLENEAAFFSSETVKKLEAAKKEDTPVLKATFQTGEFPAGEGPRKYTQFSRITIDESKGDELRTSWDALTVAIGQTTFGGVSVGDGPKVGLGLLGWNSLEEAGAAFSKPEAAAAFAKWKSLGESKSVVAEMVRY